MAAGGEFEVERPRLVRIAAGILGDRHEAQDVVQLAWLRFNGADSSEIRSLPAWLTTVTTRLCLDRLRARVPEPVDPTAYGSAEMVSDTGLDPLEEVALADSVGVALNVVLECLTPSERVAFILHDTFGVEFGTIARVLDISPVAARKLGSRARGKVGARLPDRPPADWEVVDAFLEAAKGGDFARLLHLLAPNVV
ncbi:MAG: sigma-70 family RNA polymerase sigma factor, partial [Nostocoides sp.]